jgi:hypothetical protein
VEVRREGEHHCCGGEEGGRGSITAVTVVEEHHCCDSGGGEEGSITATTGSWE